MSSQIPGVCLATTFMRHADVTSIEGTEPKWTRPRDDTSQGNDSVEAALSVSEVKPACQFAPLDCSAQALLRSHKDGQLRSNQPNRGMFDEFHTDSDAIRVPIKPPGDPIAGDIGSA